MSRLPSRGIKYFLVLANGRRWVITAGDEKAAPLVSRLGAAMRMDVAGDAVEPGDHERESRLIVRVDEHHPDASPTACHALLHHDADGSIVCHLQPYDADDGLFVHLSELAAVMARGAQADGGILLHGALAEREGSGVILAASGGTGKSTASNRFPPPWNPLCDDTTLVVRDPQGDYRAHPWPTWSSFLPDGPGGCWDVRKAVPLRGIFFLKQSQEDRVERIGKGQAATLLAEAAAQASQLMVRILGKEDSRVLHRERFDNITALVRCVPSYILQISLTGRFWLEMDKALCLQGKIQ